MNGANMVDAMQPVSVAELVEAIRSAPRVIAVGGGTTPRLSAVGDEFMRVSTTQVRGIIEYEPDEFTFTALAGTPVREVIAVLAERGQHLPFDPVFAAEGATLGGMMAAGVNGPGRFRFGGLRDFIVGIRFVDGAGGLRRAGGKVVKNAAGFDLPKFFVGSAGRFGVLAEVSFKVFPKPTATRTLRLEATDAATKTRCLCALAAGRWEIDALDAAIAEGAVFARLAGPSDALVALGNDILTRWPGTMMPAGEVQNFWTSITGFRWAHTNGALVKVALTPAQVADFIAFTQSRAGGRGWISAGGNVGYLSFARGTEFPALPWPGVTLRGDAPLWCGPQSRFAAMQAVKQALDPDNRFPGLDE
jgi:glycolate oxidase FAD binding subunit